MSKELDYPISHVFKEPESPPPVPPPRALNSLSCLS